MPQVFSAYEIVTHVKLSLLTQCIQLSRKKETQCRGRITNTVKALLSPRGGGLFNFGPSRWGLNREGDLLEKWAYSQNQVTGIYFGNFSVLLSYNLQNQHTILRLKYINSTKSLSQIILKLTCKVV